MVIRAHPEVDTSRASVARSYDAALGGKDNFAVDREALRRQMAVFPAAPLVARANRRWLVRVVGYLADRAGADQFLDLGSGLPTAENTHEVAQRYQKDAAVVYVRRPAAGTAARGRIAHRRLPRPQALSGPPRARGSPSRSAREDQSPCRIRCDSPQAGPRVTGVRVRRTDPREEDHHERDQRDPD